MSDEKELNRRKEVDDLISKYARKKAPPHPVGPPPPLGHQNSAHGHHPGGPIPLQKDYSSSSLKFRDSHYGGGGGGGGPANHHSSRPGDNNIYGTMPNSHSQRDSLYGSSNLYGGASTSNLFPRRSSQYDMPPPPLPSGVGHQAAQYGGVEPPIYEQGPQRPQKYLATSKSSSNLYLQPHYGTGYGNMDPNRSLTRQQKTLSMHGVPAPSTATGGGGGRNNNVMDTAAAIIANAHQQSNMGLGTTTDWWNTSYGGGAGGVPQPPPPGLPGPVVPEVVSGLPTHQDWNNLAAPKPNAWNPLPSFGNNSASSSTTTTSNKPVLLTFCFLCEYFYFCEYIFFLLLSTPV